MHVELPAWVAQQVAVGQRIENDAERLAMAIELSRLQSVHGSGGPFGALVCDDATGEVIGVGVNLVESTGLSSAHAEWVAWSMAQSHMGQYDLGADSNRAMTLYSSSQPCVACWGGLVWSGVTRLVYGATKDDVEALLGFDEGPLPNDWRARLESRGIAVAGPLQRKQAVQALEFYKQSGGLIYSPRQGCHETE